MFVILILKSELTCEDPDQSSPILGETRSAPRVKASERNRCFGIYSKGAGKVNRLGRTIPLL